MKRLSNLQKAVLAPAREKEALFVSPLQLGLFGQTALLDQGFPAIELPQEQEGRSFRHLNLLIRRAFRVSGSSQRSLQISAFHPALNLPNNRVAGFHSH